jgi:O-antigen/teichoic acid export membrane protein
MSVGLALVAPELAPLALGQKWADAGPLMGLCALYALVDALAQYSFNVFIVLGRQRRQVVTYLCFLALRVPLVLYGAMTQGALGVAAALLFTGIVGTVVWNSQMIRLIGAGSGQWWAEIWRTLLAAAAMTVCLLSLGAWALPAEPVTAATVLPRLLLYVLTGAAVHGTVQFLLWHVVGRPAGPEARGLRIAGGALQRLRAVLRRDPPISA